MSTTLNHDAELVTVWRADLATTVWELRSQGLHLRICKEQVMELAAIRCEWGSLARFRAHCGRP